MESINGISYYLNKIVTRYQTSQTTIFGLPFVKLFALCYWSVVLSVCLSVCNVRSLWPNGWTDQDVTWRAGRPRP